jgi:cation diffusion facilitator family transporter
MSIFHSKKSHSHNNEEQLLIHERKTKIVVIITFITMIAEIYFGYTSNSMALLSDGWHMSSHVFAIGLSMLAYIISRKYSDTKTYSFSKTKLLALSGFVSAFALLFIAIFMAIESIERIANPLKIEFSEAILVAIIGLVVNVISAFALNHEHEHSDHNIKAAYLHVLADILTSLTAIFALLAGYFYGINSLDAISGIISAILIIKWSYSLILNSAKELLDFKNNKVS